MKNIKRQISHGVQTSIRDPIMKKFRGYRTNWFERELIRPVVEVWGGGGNFNHNIYVAMMPLIPGGEARELLLGRYLD